MQPNDAPSHSNEPSPPEPPPVSPVQEDAIEQRARMIWEQQGRPKGRAVEHWLQAEREYNRLNRPDVPWATLASFAPFSTRTISQMMDPTDPPRRSATSI